MLEESLKTIKDCELDIELLHRKNEKLCNKNNLDIDYFKKRIIETEKLLETELKKSGKDKLECKFGYCSYRNMPDSWIYDEKELLAWLDTLPTEVKKKYYKVNIIIKKADLKKEISEHNPDSFTDGKMTQKFLDSDVAGHEMFISFIDDLGENFRSVQGIKVGRQDPKFSYKIK